MPRHSTLTPEARSLARLNAMLPVSVLQHPRLPSTSYASDALLDLRMESRSWLFEGLRPWIGSELVVYEHVSRRFSIGEANKMVAKAVIARAGRAGSLRGWPAARIGEAVSLLVVCERPDEGTREVINTWCDAVGQGIWHKTHGTLVKVTVIALNTLPVTPDTLGLHLLGEVRSRAKLSRLAEGLRESEGLDKFHHDDVMEYLLAIEAEMNVHTRRPRTPLLDAARATGEARGEARGEAKGTRNTLLLTARRLGASDHLLDQAESLPDAEAIDLLNEWMDAFVQRMEKSGL